MPSPSYRLTDDQWRAIEPHLPTSRGRRGGQYKDHRPMVEGILWVLADGGRWRNVPPAFGSWSSVFDRFRRWTRSGVWGRVLAALRDRKAAAGEIDARLYSIDGSVVRAHVSAAGAAKQKGPAGEPADHALGRSQGGFGTEVHLICDGRGPPLAVTISPGQQHETRQVCALLEPILEEGRAPKALAGDKAYSAGWVRALLAEIGIKAVIPHKANENAKPKRFPRTLYKGRHVIECCFGKLKWLRRVATRYEKLALHYLGMLHVAIIYRFIASGFTILRPGYTPFKWPEQRSRRSPGFGQKSRLQACFAEFKAHNPDGNPARTCRERTGPKRTRDTRAA